MRNGFEKESAKVKGNQVEILSDPVTVFGESVFNIPLHNPIMIHVRRGGQTFVSVSQETCLYVVRLKLPSKVLHPV